MSARSACRGPCSRKPGPLDEAEREQLRSTAEIGARLIDDPQFADVREWVLAHQERPDGHGYPHGLKAEEIRSRRASWPLRMPTNR